MKTFLIALLLITPVTAQARGALFEKVISVPADQAALRTPPPADPTALIESLRWQVLQASNLERSRVGLPPLSADPVLDEAAARYSRKMRDFQFFDHVAPDGETLDGRIPPTEMWRFESLAENLWSGQGALDWRADSISTEAAANWVESPGHRENLFDPTYTLAGVGSAMSGDRLYITMLYGLPVANQAQAILQRDFGDAPADTAGFSVQVEQRLSQALNIERAQIGLSGLVPDAVLSQTARSHARNALASGGFTGGVLDAAFAADPARTGRLSAGFWRASGALVWQAEAMAQSVVANWLGGQTGAEALDPGFAQIGVGVASDGASMMVVVLFGEGGGIVLN